MSTGILSKPALGPYKVDPRPYQSEAIAAVRAEYVKGIRRTMLILATGTGKTLVSSFIGRKVIEKGGRILFLAPSTELVDQAANKFDLVGIEVGIEQSKQQARAIFEPDAVIGSIQTMKGKRLSSWSKDYFNMIIVDECDYGFMGTYRKILDYFGNARVLGISATIARTDEEDLGQFYESVAYTMSAYDGMTAPAPGPYLCRLIYDLVPDLDIDLRDLRPKKGDLSSDELDARIAPLADTLANAIRKEAENRRTLIYTPGIRSAQGIATALSSLMVSAESVSGDDHEREAKVERFRKGETQMLASCSLFLRGFDVPEVAAIALCRPTKSQSLLDQIIGRGLRLALGKENCIAEGELILTDIGLVPIEEVTRDMTVWDGLEFVSHGGAVFKGERDVITYAGLTATPDHKVWTDQGWKTFGSCSKERTLISVTGIGRKVVWEADHRFRRTFESEERERCGLGRMPVWSEVNQGLPQRHQQQGRMSQMWATQTSSSMALCPSAGSQKQMSQSKRETIRGLWWTWNPVPIRVSDGYGLVDSIQSRSSQGYDHRSDRQRRPLRTRESPISDQQTEHLQSAGIESHCKNARSPNESSRDSLCGCYANEDVQYRDVRRGDHRTISSSIIQTKRRVWDILNAGPRHRFTASGLLVSNCRLIDFNYLTDGYDLARPIALLETPFMDGGILDAAQEEMKKDKQLDMLEAVERGEKIHRERQILRIKAKEREMKYRRVLYDPLSVCDALGIPWQGRRVVDVQSNFATDKQIATLKKLGIDGAEKMSKTRATTLLNFLFARIRANKASARQVACMISKGGMEPEAAREMSFEDAKVKLDSIFGQRSA